MCLQRERRDSTSLNVGLFFQRLTWSSSLLIFFDLLNCFFSHNVVHLCRLGHRQIFRQRREKNGVSPQQGEQTYVGSAGNSRCSLFYFFLFSDLDCLVNCPLISTVRQSVGPVWGVGCYSVFSRETEPRCMYRERNSSWGIGLHAYGDWLNDVCRVGCQSGNPEGLRLQLKSASEFPVAPRGQSVLFRPSTDRMSSTHIRENNLFHSKSTNLYINLIKKHPQRNIQENVWPHTGHFDPTKLAGKMNHHKGTGAGVGDQMTEPVTGKPIFLDRYFLSLPS